MTTAKPLRKPETQSQTGQLALNQPTKSKAKAKTPTATSATINSADIEKNKKDVQSLNSDLQLLSSLLGRPISPKDLPQLTKQLTTPPGPAIELSFPGSSPISHSTSKTPLVTDTSLTKEAELLHRIIQKQNGGGDDSTKASSAADENKVFAEIDPADAYGKTNDALLATLLKQRGIGPSHNNIPTDLYSSTATTITEQPQFSAPRRPSRPIVDGLSWLWKTWQDTAPGTGGYQSQGVRTRTRGLAPSSDATAAAATDTGATNAELNFDDGLDSDIASVRSNTSARDAANCLRTIVFGGRDVDITNRGFNFTGFSFIENMFSWLFVNILGDSAHRANHIV